MPQFYAYLMRSGTVIVHRSDFLDNEDRRFLRAHPDILWVHWDIEALDSDGAVRSAIAIEAAGLGQITPAGLKAAAWAVDPRAQRRGDDDGVMRPSYTGD